MRTLVNLREAPSALMDRWNRLYLLHGWMEQRTHFRSRIFHTAYKVGPKESTITYPHQESVMSKDYKTEAGFCNPLR